MTMHLRPKDEAYEKNQLFGNLVHVNGEFENDDDVRKAKAIAGDIKACGASRVLEVGTRLGLAPFIIARTVRHLEIVAGVDIVEDFINIARIRGKYVSANNPSINLGYICCDMHELPCLDDSFDYVFSIGVLEHAHDPAKAISEIFRVCSGRVYLDIDCANLTRDAGSHYTVGAEPEDWLKLCPPEAQLQWIYSGDVLCIRGEVE